MKKFAFSLERMLGYKRSLYEKERNALAQLRAQRAALELRKTQTQNQILAQDEAFRHKAAADGVGAEEVAKLSYQRENAHNLVRQLDADMAQLDVAIERQLQVVIALDRDVKSLEKMREKQFAEYTAEAIKEEQERIGELVSSRFAEEQREAAE